ncbi:coproporphyrinogen-III oxidase family protein [Cylindrospermum sp. FACHB-282]|uniref:coproporphyrinogen-III oxidase family protein n=1 Tax=Cylindrospermum sp. FACHB-282 TaxID=2692794 RepID=UPI001689B294|nr:radical SAM protein [Cylindrospermum sp. FACHB-282]MBD2385988.1 radical SAM protein [Cylindrospermum sp. FACHB-282]
MKNTSELDKSGISDLAIYVNIPFCNSKCHFCHYVADIDSRNLVGQHNWYSEYVEAIKRQILHYLPQLTSDGHQINSIYFGGGTPTALSTEQLIDILQVIESNSKPSLHFGSVTLETTPENAPHHDFRALLDAGFNRISMGVQSMDNNRLRMIGRSHCVEQVQKAIEIFWDAGFTNVNIDMMFGMPSESKEEISHNLEKLVALAGNHYSIYLYEPDPRTVMAKRCESSYTTEDLYSKFDLVLNYMENAGYEGYNCFYYANDNSRCDCDDIYYNLGNDWIGFGAGAHSLLQQCLYRTSSDYKHFIATPLTIGSPIPARENAIYLYMTSTYLLYSDKGLNLNQFERMLGISYQDALAMSKELQLWHEHLTTEGNLVLEGGHWRFRNREDQIRYICHHMERRFKHDILKSQQFAQPYAPLSSK